MVSVTFSVPDDIKGLMKELAWVNWSEIAREDLFKRIKAEHMREQLKSPDEQSFINWSVELGKHKAECISKSGLSSFEFNERFREIESQIEFIPLSQFEHLLAKIELSDADDVPYIAAAQRINGSIWSNDSDLKEQFLVKVFTTAELVGMLLEGKL